MFEYDLYADLELALLDNRETFVRLSLLENGRAESGRLHVPHGGSPQNFVELR